LTQACGTASRTGEKKLSSLVKQGSSSLFWFFPEIEELLDNGYKVDLHHCMHEDTRKKLTTSWATHKVFGKLSILCDGRHANAKWNPKPVGQQLTFPTTEEEKTGVFENLPKGARIVQRRL